MRRMTVVIAGISNRRIEEITGLERIHAQSYLAANADTIRNAMEDCGKKVAATLWEMREGKEWPDEVEGEVDADEPSEEA
jgi:hypothetical protein